MKKMYFTVLTGIENVSVVSKDPAQIRRELTQEFEINQKARVIT